MTKREAVVIGAYTGILVGRFLDLHEYTEELLERPVVTHELEDKAFWETIKVKSRAEFLKLEVE